MAGRVWVAVVLLATVACGGDPAPAPTPTAVSPAPPPPVAADFAALASVVGQVAALPGARPLDPRTAELRGPHFSLAVGAVARTTGPAPDAVAAAVRLPAGSRPAPGQELMLVDLRPAAGPYEADSVEVAAVLVAGATRRPVPVVTGLPGTLLVSVPAGAPATLEVTDAGRRQTLDLATGRRGAEVTGYYPMPTGVVGADDGRPTRLVLYGPGVAGLAKPDREAFVQLGDVTARLQPYVAGRGWARTGRGFLVVTTEVGWSRAEAGDTDTVTVPARCFRATGPGGAALPLAAAPVTVEDPPAPVRLVADVPAGLRRVTVRFAFCGSIRTAAGEVSYQVESTPAQTAVLALR